MKKRLKFFSAVLLSSLMAFTSLPVYAEENLPPTEEKLEETIKEENSSEEVLETEKSVEETSEINKETKEETSETEAEVNTEGEIDLENYTITLHLPNFEEGAIDLAYDGESYAYQKTPKGEKYYQVKTDQTVKEFDLNEGKVVLSFPKGKELNISATGYFDRTADLKRNGESFSGNFTLVKNEEFTLTTVRGEKAVSAGYTGFRNNSYTTTFTFGSVVGSWRGVAIRQISSGGQIAYCLNPNMVQNAGPATYDTVWGIQGNLSQSGNPSANRGEVYSKIKRIMSTGDDYAGKQAKIWETMYGDINSVDTSGANITTTRHTISIEEDINLVRYVPGTTYVFTDSSNNIQGTSNHSIDTASLPEGVIAYIEGNKVKVTVPLGFRENFTLRVNGKNSDNSGNLEGTIWAHSNGSVQPIFVPKGDYSIRRESWDGFEVPFELGMVDITVKKVSSKEVMTNGNGYYSLKGARFTLRGAGGTYKFTTDEKGEAKLKGVLVGKYTLIEEEAPYGFNKISPKEVVIESGDDLVVKNDPQTDPINIILSKKDATNNQNGYVQPGATLEGAVFHFDFYYQRGDRLLTKEDIQSGNYRPDVSFDATTVLHEGEYKVRLRKNVGSIVEDSFVSARGNLDDFFDHRGFMNFPVGTMTVSEKTPPVGYSKHNVVIKDKVTGELVTDNFFVAQVTGDGSRLNVLNELTVEEQPILIHTTATDSETNDHIAKADEEVTIVDVIRYENVVSGTYSFTGTLFDKVTGESVKRADGSEVTSTKQFEVTEPNGTVEMQFTFDASDLGGHDVVVYERLYYADGSLAAVHEDPNDPGQTVKIPRIGTKASDAKTNSHYGNAGEREVIINDVVNYHNLIAGKTYEMVGNLYNKATGEKIPGVAEVKKSFIATESDGSVTLNFIVNASLVEGKEVVAFESLRKEGIEIALHADINDASQTVSYPKVRTEAISKATNLHILELAEEVSIKETVTVENLEVGKTYRLDAILMNGRNKEVFTVKNQGFTASKTFMATEKNETHEFEFVLNTTELEGSKIVVFETLTMINDDGSEVVVGQHKDINAKSQTVSVLKIGTTATGVDGSSKTVSAVEDVIIKDKISYVGIIPGEEYTVKGWIVDTNGNPVNPEVKAEKTFIPTSEDGEVILEFHMNTLGKDEKEFVVFEELYYKGQLIAKHKDPKDKDQTVKVRNITMKSLAFNGEDGSDTFNPKMNSHIHLIDEVEYRGLPTGKRYVMTATLHKRTEDGKDAGVLMINGQEAKASVEFSPSSSEGKVEVHFNFNLRETGLKDGDSLVVFEVLRNAETGEVHGRHEDINDENQTVYISSTRRKRKRRWVKTDAGQGMILYGGSFLVSGLALVYVLKKKKEVEK